MITLNVVNYYTVIEIYCYYYRIRGIYFRNFCGFSFNNVSVSDIFVQF